MVILLFLLGCGKQVEKPSAVESPESSIVVAETIVTEFPPIDLQCTEDSDCGTFFSYLTDDGRCCGGCTPQVASQSWIAEANMICSSKDKEGCPMKKCLAPPPVQCVEGSCQAVQDPADEKGK